MTDLSTRARRAYFAAASREGFNSPPQPASPDLEITHDGKPYVVLDNCRGTLAVYRLKGDGKLRRLKRWPKAVAAA